MPDQFEKFIVERSRKLDMSISDLARRAKLSRESLYKLLRGETRNPAINTLYGLAIALNVSPIYLLRIFFGDRSTGPGTELPVRYADDHVSFVRDVTIPDNMTVLVNSSFVKTWEIQNTGKIKWRNRLLVCQDDDFVLARRMDDGSLQEIADCHLLPMEASVPVPDADPGDVVQVSVEFTAPSFPCSVISSWKMADEQGKLCFPGFTGVWVQVRVMGL